STPGARARASTRAAGWRFVGDFASRCTGGASAVPGDELHEGAAEIVAVAMLADAQHRHLAGPRPFRERGRGDAEHPCGLAGAQVFGGRGGGVNHADLLRGDRPGSATCYTTHVRAPRWGCSVTAAAPRLLGGRRGPPLLPCHKKNPGH